MPRLFKLHALIAGVVLAFANFPAAAQIAPVASPSGPAAAGPYIVIDAATGETLLQRNPGTFWYPASLTKLMTIYIVFEELKAGRLTLGAPLTFSQHASSMPESRLGVAVGGSITVEQGLLSLVARSANDVAVAFAERIGGSEPAFAVHMTETATRLGMSATQYRNANGLPDPGQLTTARDLALLAMALARDFPQYYSYFRTQDFMLGNRKVGPGIKFLELYAPYAEGLKTGFVCSSGFNIVGSAMRDGRRLIAVALGFRRSDLRDEFVIRLFDEAFLLKTGGNRPKVWQLQSGNGGGPVTVLDQHECYQIRYDLPGDAVWVGTYPDWRQARVAFDNAQARIATLGMSRLGKEYILPVTVNKTTKQAAILADMVPADAQKLCADYQARKLFCEVHKPQDVVAPFSGFWR
jgi:D-alanyl-D-alanine carboxypeptidase